MEGLVEFIALAASVPMGILTVKYGLFGGSSSKQELEEAAKEKQELEKKLERAEARTDESRKKLDKVQERVKELEAQLSERCKKDLSNVDACKKAEQDKAEAEKAMRAMDSRMRDQAAAMEALSRELATLKEGMKTLEKDARSARDEAVRLADEVKKAEARAQRAAEKPVRPPKPEREPEKPRPEPAPEDRGLKEKLRQLEDTLKAKDRIIRALREQKEHSRRAFVITQLQLDLAHDEVYFLKNGKRRRDTQLSRAQVPEAGPVDAEDFIEDLSDELPDSEVTPDKDSVSRGEE